MTPDEFTRAFVRRPWWRRYAVLLAVGAVLLGAALTAGAVLVLDDDRRPAASSAAQDPTPTPRLDARATCAALVPLLNDAGMQFLHAATQPDGSTLDLAQIRRLIAGLRDVNDVAAEPMRLDIGAVIVGLRELENLAQTGAAAVNFERATAAGTTLAEMCQRQS